MSWRGNRGEDLLIEVLIALPVEAATVACMAITDQTPAEPSVEATARAETLVAAFEEFIVAVVEDLRSDAVEDALARIRVRERFVGVLAEHLDAS